MIILNFILLSMWFEMKKGVLIFILSVSFLSLISSLIIFLSRNSRWNRVLFNNKTFNVELATTDEQRQKWLMFREYLSEDDWMLFVFDAVWIYSFWMKNTLIPLDMIWIDVIDWENRVVDIQTAQPCEVENCPSFHPKWNSLYVLEINAWLAKKYDINIWDLVSIDVELQ